MTELPEQRAVLERLNATLEEYFQAVPRQREPNPPDLMAIFARLEMITDKVDDAFPAQLRHYLHQKSYRKAHLYLQGRDEESPRGNCGK
jgi:hypothetical protein